METEPAQVPTENEPTPPAGGGSGDLEALERRVERLEHANRELMRANTDLAKERLGPRDSAANALLLRAQRAEQRARSIERSLSWRVTAPLRLLKPPLRWLRDWLRVQRERLRQRRSR